MPHPIQKDLEILASKTAATYGLDIYRVQFLTHLSPMTIQVQIRHIGEKEVSLEDCSSFSKPMGEAIENSQLLNEPYVLEISSTGLSEKLINDRDFETFKGFPIEVTIKGEHRSKSINTGLLHQRSNENIYLNIKGRMKIIPRDEVLDVRLISPTG